MLALLAAVLFALSALPVQLYAADARPRVLYLSSYHPAFPTFSQQIAGIRAAMADRPILLDSEFMDAKRFTERENFELFHHYLAYKLARLPSYDAVIVGDDYALQFAIDHQQELFAGIPVVFIGVNDRPRALAQNANPLITGVIEAVSMEETLRLMVRLHPQTERIYALVDGTLSGQGDLQTLYGYRQQLAPVELADLSLQQLTYSEFVALLRQLGANDLVLLLSAYEDRQGKHLLFDESLELIRQNLSRPLYHLWYHGMGDGVLGGKLISHVEQGRVGGEMVRALLAGTPRSELPVRMDSPNQVVFDYRQMERFGLQPGDLPPGSTIVNRPLSFYQQYRSQINTLSLIFASLFLFSLGIWINLIKRQAAEQALKESERRYRAIVEDQTEFICRHRPDFTITFVNEAYVRYFKRPPEELVGQSFLPLIPEAEQEAVRRYFAGLNREHPVASHKHQVLAPEGEVRWQQWSNRAILDERGEVVEFQGVGRDITERKRSEEAVRLALAEAEEAREKIEVILASISDGLLFTNGNNRILLMSPAAENLLGFRWLERVSAPVDELLADTPLPGQLAAILCGSMEKGTVEWPAQADDSPEVRICQGRSAVVRDKGGEIAGVITLLRDVSRERELDRLKSEFISTAAHELRTPLTVVMGFADLLTNPNPLDDAQRKECLDIICQRAEQLNKIVDELLDLSRIEAGQMIQIRRVPCDLVAPLRHYARSFKLIDSSHRFEKQFSDGPINVLVDEAKLHRVLDNLLSNAAKFSPEGSLIRLWCQIEGGEVRITVSDEGIGMTPAQLERVFDKFYRVDASNTAQGGLGLGMAIVKSIIEAHEGRIWVESAPGQGTKVHFTMPLLQAVASET